ncbi:MAG: hypothetical protein KAU38_09240 [Desulfobacterales bacterium]|nr:hypothetical protein [Desulfobacterales bacterium]
MLDAGSWILDETLAQTWIIGLIGYDKPKRQSGQDMFFLFYPASSIEHPVSVRLKQCVIYSINSSV